MKISILSMQRILNYGSVLQAYSLKKMLEEQGHDVSFIDIESREEDNDLLDPKFYIHFYEDSYEEPGKNVLGNTLIKMQNKLMWINQKKMFHTFQKNKLGLNETNNSKEYDCCVIGSDEVFNCLQPSKWGFTSQLLGNVHQAKKVITYAASCGYTSADKVPEKIKPLIRESFSKIQSFSVRDANTYEFVKSFSDNEEISIHLDPVFVGDFDTEIESFSKKMRLPDNYCLIYAYSGRLNDKKSIDTIMSFCKKHNMLPIALGGIHNWIRCHPCYNPFEVLWAFKNASFVITDTFHGAIFSAKYSKRFAIVKRASNSNKLGDLLSRLPIKDHLVQEISELETKYIIEKNEEQMNEYITKDRERTIAYLKKSI